jgi:hypothetical protein
MNGLPRAIVMAAFLLGGALVVRGTFGTDRYDLFPAVGGTVYRLDRLTGSVSLCAPVGCRPLPTIVPRAPSPGPAPSTPEPPT